MEMDVGGQPDLQEERTSDRRSLSSNYLHCSQSRKISIGVLVDSIPMAKTNDLQEPGVQTAERRNSQKESIKDGEGLPQRMKKYMIAEPKDGSPWVSTVSFNPKMPSSVADQDTEHTPSFPATRQKRPRSKLLEKASAAHSLKFFAAKSGSDDVNRQKNYGKDISSMEAGKVSNVEQEENPVCPAEPGVRQEKEQVQNRDGATETGGRESLRIRLQKILDVSSRNKHLPSLQCKELHQKERNTKQCIVQKIKPNSGTIESYSHTHIFTRPMTSSLTRRKVSTRKQSSEATKSFDKIDYNVFSFKDQSAGLYDNVIIGSLPCKREKVNGVSSGAEKNQGAKQRNVGDRQQSERSIAIPPVEKAVAPMNKVSNASSSTDRRNDGLIVPKKGTKNNSSFEFPLNVRTGRRDVEQPMDVEPSKKNIQEDTSNSLLNRKRNSLQPKRGTKHNYLFEFPLMTDQTIVEQSMDVPASKKNIKDDMPDSLLIKKRNSVLTEKGTQNNSLFEFPLNAMIDQRDVELPMYIDVSKKKLQEDIPDSLLQKNSVHDPSTPPPRIKSHSSLQESKQGQRQGQSPADNLCNLTSIQSFKCLLSSKSAECRPDAQQEPSIGGYKQNNSPQRSPLVKPNIVMGEDDSHKGVQDPGELGMYMEENQENGLARSIKLFTVALAHVKTKLKSISHIRSGDILRAAVEEILSRLQNAESLIKEDVGKLTNLIHSKRKRLETRFQEKQEELLGIHKRFKAEVKQHLQECGSLIEDLEDHKIELKRSVEKQKAAHKKFLFEVEQEINVQLEDAESRIMAVKEMAREKMLQLKLGMAVHA